MPAGELGWRRRGLLRSGVPSKAQWRRRSPASGSGGGEASGLGSGRSGAAIAGSGQPLRFSAGVLAAAPWGGVCGGGKVGGGRCARGGARRRSPARAWVVQCARGGAEDGACEAAWRHLLAPDRRGASLGASATPALQPPPSPHLPLWCRQQPQPPSPLLASSSLQAEGGVRHPCLPSSRFLPGSSTA